MFQIIIDLSVSKLYCNELDIIALPQARVKLLPCSEAVPEPCLSCGRVDQPERLHTHPARETAEPGAGDTAKKEAADRQRHKSPLKVSRGEHKDFFSAYFYF